MSTTYQCAAVARGTVSSYAPGLSLLTVGYSYTADGFDPDPKSGYFYIFGDFSSNSTQNYLRRLFTLRHSKASLIDFYLTNKQP